jgi:hypothetical protein
MLRKIAVFIFLLLTSTGCATLQTKPIDLQALLNDFQWSISAACSQEYLPVDVCTFGTDALLLARGFITKDIHASEVAVRQSLIDSELKLPSDSRLRPYLDVLIAILPSV